MTATDTCDPSIPITFTKIQTPNTYTNAYLLTHT